MESKFKKGSRVSHPKYGTGTITSINGDYDRCHIRRDKDGESVNLLIEELTLLDAPHLAEPSRAIIAAMAMQGFIANGEWDGNIITMSVQYADELLAELAKPKP